MVFEEFNDNNLKSKIMEKGGVFPYCRPNTGVYFMTKYYPVPVYWSLRANLSNKINTYNLGQLCFNTKST